MLCYVPKPGYMWNPLENFPPNSPCFCNSGVKFKKCHRNKLSRTVSVEEYKKLEPYIPAIYSGKLRITRKETTKNETSIDNTSPEPVEHSPSLLEKETPREYEHGEQPEPVIVTPAILKSDGCSDTNS